MSDHGTSGTPYQAPEDITPLVLIVPLLMGLTLITTVITAILMF